MDLEESRRQRENADWELRGNSPGARRAAAKLRATALRKQGREVEQWVLDVAEGRLPA
ncbi:hypothetical protein [Gordonia sp. FQ]|uniref:hypothetical protein n=1 Tax=Gordonia sp. FQ TaxID=3446634 RepID=UPI003F87B5B0